MGRARLRAAARGGQHQARAVHVCVCVQTVLTHVDGCRYIV